MSISKLLGWPDKKLGDNLVIDSCPIHGGVASC